MFRSLVPYSAIRLSALPLLAALVFTAAPAVAQTKVAVIDVQRVVNECNLGQAAQKELEELQKSKTAELKAQADALEALRTQIQEGELSLAREKLTEMAEEFERKGREFKRAQDDANLELKRKGEKLMGDIEVKVLPIIDQIGKSEGYTVILNKFRSGLLFADDSIDITQQVIDQLNQASAGQ
jgi:outer membrane protein